mmetsp:Transcript_71560/g.226005  ORF Transcript_71560/g.226005 Transcript_71560/m.226005 type:complete len:287 (-) Transcript_71560:12-872(-)
MPICAATSCGTALEANVRLKRSSSCLRARSGRSPGPPMSPRNPSQCPERCFDDLAAGLPASAPVQPPDSHGREVHPLPVQLGKLAWGGLCAGAAFLGLGVLKLDCARDRSCTERAHDFGGGTKAALPEGAGARALGAGFTRHRIGGAPRGAYPRPRIAAVRRRPAQEEGGAAQPGACPPLRPRQRGWAGKRRATWPTLRLHTAFRGFSRHAMTSRARPRQRASRHHWLLGVRCRGGHEGLRKGDGPRRRWYQRGPCLFFPDQRPKRACPTLAKEARFTEVLGGGCF